MKSSWSSRRIVVSTGVVLVVSLLLLIIQITVSPLGYLAVKTACREEGGMRILQRVKVDGYWHGVAGWSGVPLSRCLTCPGQVARGDFEYVDAESFDLYTNKPIGFVRFRLISRDEGTCYDGPSSADPPAGKCVSASPLESEPTQGYKFQSDVIRRSDYFGASILEQRRQIIDINSRQAIATHSFFSHSTPISRYGRFAASYHCEYAIDSSERDFVRDVLGGSKAI